MSLWLLESLQLPLPNCYPLMFVPSMSPCRCDLHTDYCNKYSCFVDYMRIWGITLTDQEHGEALDRIISSYSRADDILEGVKFLRPIINEVTTQVDSSSNEQEPMYYEELQQQAADKGSEALPIAFAQRRPRSGCSRESSDNDSSGSRIVRVAPPASSNHREYTMLRLLDLTDVVMHKLLTPEGLDTQYEDVPFR